jgi:multisubunit Na+/H+ antiporter MnhB subunit
LTPYARRILFLVSCLCLLPGIAIVAWHMPAFGAHPLPYGDAIDAAAPAQRHVTNMVSAINFDYRGFDTLGEEFMLLCAVTGTVVLLRGQRGEQLDALPGLVDGRKLLPHSDAVLLISRLAAPLIILFGVYVALHAMTTAFRAAPSSGPARCWSISAKAIAAGGRCCARRCSTPARASAPPCTPCAASPAWPSGCRSCRISSPSAP